MKGLGYNENNRLALRCAHYESYRKIAEAVQALLSEIYIDVEPVLIDGSNFASFLRGQEGWDVALNYAAMGGAMFYDFNRFLNSAGSTQPLYGFNSPEYDAMQAAAMNAGSYEAMSAEFEGIQKWVMEQVAFLPLAVGNRIVAAGAEVEGLMMNPNEQALNFSTVRIPE
jgi:ABC-type transport system substrate-binding protein